MAASLDLGSLVRVGEVQDALKQLTDNFNRKLADKEVKVHERFHQLNQRLRQLQ